MNIFVCQFRAMPERFRIAYHVGDYTLAEYEQLVPLVNELGALLQRPVSRRRQQRAFGGAA